MIFYILNTRIVLLAYLGGWMACKASEELTSKSILSIATPTFDVDTLFADTPATELQASNHGDCEATVAHPEPCNLANLNSAFEHEEESAPRHIWGSHNHIRTSICPVWQSQDIQTTYNPNEQLREEFAGANPSPTEMNTVLSLQNRMLESSSHTAPGGLAGNPLTPSDPLYQNFQNVHGIHLYPESSKKRKDGQDTHIDNSLGLSHLSMMYRVQSSCGVNDGFMESNGNTAEPSIISNSIYEPSWEILREGFLNSLNRKTDVYCQSNEKTAEPSIIDNSINEPSLEILRARFFHSINRKTDLYCQSTLFLLNNDFINVSEILTFDVDAFSQKEYLSPKDKLRAETIITFIKEHGNERGHLFISADYPNLLNSFFNTARYEKTTKIPKSQRLGNYYYQAKTNNRKKSQKCLSTQREYSIEKLISNRHHWYSFWYKRAGIDIQDGEESHSFQIELTLLLIYTDIIGTILARYHAPGLNYGEDQNVELLRKAYSVAFEGKLNTSEQLKRRLQTGESTPPQTSCKKRRKVPPFPSSIGNTQCRKSLARVWAWIAILLKDLNNKDFNNIFFKEGGFTLNFSVQLTFNSIFFHSIPKLNQRLINYVSKKLEDSSL
jgi:hypothetical protein